MEINRDAWMPASKAFTGLTILNLITREAYSKRGFDGPIRCTNYQQVEEFK